MDVSLLIGFGDEPRYVDDLLGTFSPRLSDALQFALDNGVLLVSASDSVPLDIAMAVSPFEERVILRGSRFQFSAGVSLLTASAEDVIVLKSVAARDADWADIEGIVVGQSELDWDYVIEHLQPLCELKESPAIMERLDDIRHRSDDA